MRMVLISPDRLGFPKPINRPSRKIHLNRYLYKPSSNQRAFAVSFSACFAYTSQYQRHFRIIPMPVRIFPKGTPEDHPLKGTLIHSGTLGSIRLGMKRQKIDQQIQQPSRDPKGDHGDAHIKSEETLIHSATLGSIRLGMKRQKIDQHVQQPAKDPKDAQK
jgi:hypothetical protein